MVEATHRKIHFQEFIPGHKKKTKEERDKKALTLNVSVKYGMITFPTHTCTELGLTGKFIKLFYEPTKKIIGFRIYERSMELEKLKTMKLVKLGKPHNTYKVSIGPMLREFANLNQDSYNLLKLKKYVETEMLGKGDTYFYVKLRNTKELEQDKLSEEE